jgi:hypothetical protein
MGIKAITVCVGYDDFLRLTIARVLQHVDKLLVVTSHADVRTQELVAQYPKAVCHKTDAFYDDGASFNKGKAMEEGFDVLGRNGWVLILDADIVLPATIPHFELQSGKLYTPARRIMTAIDGLTELPEIDMKKLPLRQESGNFGYFQLFHADDPVIRTLPWYETTWVHAGGADSVFEKRWAKANRLRMPFEVVHLGDPDQNWYGRVRPRLDTGEVDASAAERLQKVEALHRKYGWKGRRKTGEAVVERVGETSGGVEPCHNNPVPVKTGTRKNGKRVIIVKKRGPVGKPATIVPQPPSQPPRLRPLPNDPSAS